MTVDKPITTFLNDSIQNPFHLIYSKYNEIIKRIGKLEENQPFYKW